MDNPVRKIKWSNKGYNLAAIGLNGSIYNI